MRILSLTIEGYKMFNPSQKINLGKDLNLLIGINGSGKSTILEAIAIIFDEVKNYCNDPKIYERKFNFSIEYTFNKSTIIEETSTTQNSKLNIHNIFLSSSKESDLQYTMSVDGKTIKTVEEIFQFLPDNLIFYYAGACETLEEIIDNVEEKQLEKLRNLSNENNIQKVIDHISKNIIYIKKEHFPILFLLNYIDQKMELPFSKKKFTIRNISFEYQQYRFTKSNNNKNLFNLSGQLRKFVDNLLKHAFNGVEFDEESNTSYFNIEYHRGLFEAVEELENLSDDQKYNQTKIILFHYISLLFSIGFLKKIHVALNDEKDSIYTIDDLSEGEQQLIILESIKKNLCRLNTVLFLDEPDAYLHPQRQREILPYLKKIFNESYTQIIATSHSPFVAQSIEKENILIFNNNGKYKTNEDEILTQATINNELFGIESEYSIEIEDKIKKFQDLVNKIQLKKTEITEEFYMLRDELNYYGEATRFITSFEVRKLISNGFQI